MTIVNCGFRDADLLRCNFTKEGLEVRDFQDSLTHLNWRMDLTGRNGSISVMRSSGRTTTVLDRSGLDFLADWTSMWKQRVSALLFKPKKQCYIPFWLWSPLVGANLFAPLNYIQEHDWAVFHRMNRFFRLSICRQFHSHINRNSQYVSWFFIMFNQFSPSVKSRP